MKVTTPQITVVGSFAVGMTIRAPHFPVAGETLRGSDFDLGPGGKGSNQAVAAARLGAQSSLIARVGQDMFAEIAVALYQREHVNMDFLLRSASRPTGVGFITLNAGGENHIILDMGANELLAPADVDAAEALIARSQVVMAVLEIRQETAARAMALGRKNGALTILNPAPAERLDAGIFGNIDVLTPNEGELRILLGLSPDDPSDTLVLAKNLQAQGIKNVVVTLGSKGALVVEAGKNEQLVAGFAVPVTDTTGAGDAFNAALAFALANNKPLLEAVRFATVAGALACTKLGVIPALPYLDEIETRMQAAKLS